MSIMITAKHTSMSSVNEKVLEDPEFHTTISSLLFGTLLGLKEYFLQNKLQLL